jgi:RHS repeat-associated protein
MRIYIEGYEYYEDFNSTFITETLSLIDNGQRFVMIENRTEPGVPTPLTRYIHPNHQSSCTLETDDNGDVITYEEYHPFGTTSYQATNPAINAAAKRYRYTGMERDEETGLNYHKARYYIPWLGRWLNPDPIGIGDGVNVYAYCRNNPVMNLDKQGTQTVEPPKSDEEIPLIEQKTSPKGSSDNPILLDEVTITATKTSVTAGEAARMADNVYGDPNAAELINGWQKSELKIPGVEFNNPETGFQSALYERTNAEGVTEYAYVFAGTNDLLTDAKEDAAQALGMDAPQFEQAARNARTISDALRGNSLTFVGHSLGGGLASAAALATGRNAITFNAAGLHSNTKAANDLNMQAQIDAYIVQGEIVDYSQSSLGLATAEGTRHELKASYVPQIWGTKLDDAYRTYQRVENHLMGTVIQKMQQQGIR